MIHSLWETHKWEDATEEEVIAALFNAPKLANPLDYRTHLRSFF
jgi:hypothetical protein